MACDGFKTYGTGTPVMWTSPDHRPRSMVFSEQWFDNWPAQLMDGGMTCQQAFAYIEDNWQFVPGLVNEDGSPAIISRLIVKADSVVALCSALAYNGGTGGTFVTRDLDLINPVTIGGQNTPETCTPSPTTTADGWGNLVFDGFVGTASTWLPLVEIIETVDLIGWYNCIAPTCSIVPIGPTEAPHFLIP
ncbi:MAG TPA: hypothetical protein VJM50_21120, partial [Pyrinomonadaceae bacterium]|nr:hypothetical protein [Pyrinomonadaceae bacterium]